MEKFRLVQTCGACPEQYDVYLGDVQVGYMRLRHGYFRVEYQGETVYSAETDGDGTFRDYERDKFLNEGCRAIQQKLDERPEENLFVIE